MSRNRRSSPELAEFRFHRLANLFPMVDGKARKELEADIRLNGLIEPIVLFEGAILDGRNRYRAAKKVGAKLTFVKYVGNDALGYVLSLNLHRRHLDDGQRAMVAAKIATLSRGDNQHSPNGGTSQAQAAAMLNVGKRSVERAAVVREHATIELKHAVEQGRIPVSVAADLATASVERQRAVLATLPRGVDGRLTPGAKKLLAPLIKEIRAERVADKKALRAAREISLASKQRALPEKKYGVIYADPEWDFRVRSDAGKVLHASNHYPVSSTEVIAARPVGNIAAKDCVLFLWATQPMIPDALAVMEAWGFRYVSHFVWTKNRAGTGFWNRSQHELLLVGTRGRPPAPAPGTQWRSTINAKVGRHSEKPTEFYRLIESYYPNLPKIELNSRRKRTGWARWGNESPD